MGPPLPAASVRAGCAWRPEPGVGQGGSSARCEARRGSTCPDPGRATRRRSLLLAARIAGLDLRQLLLGQPEPRGADDESADEVVVVRKQLVAALAGAERVRHLALAVREDLGASPG